MEIAERKEAETVIIDIKGKVNIQSAPDLRNAIKKNVDAAAKRIYVRLADVDYMDSSGVGVLVSGMKLAKEKKISFALVEVAKPVMLVIEVTRLVNIFKIYPTLAAAMEQPN